MGIKPIIIAIVAIAVIGGGAFYVQNNNDDNGQRSSSQSSEGTGGKLTSINDLLAQNRNIKCTYSYTDDDGNESSGTTYIAGEKMRGNFTVRTSGQPEQKSNVLRDDTYQYVWTEGSNTGFKTKISAITPNNSKNDSDDGKTQAVDQDKKYDFDCSEWSVDESMFKTPGNVKFTDYSVQLMQSQKVQQDAADVQREACEKISDSYARKACKDAL